MIHEAAGSDCVSKTISASFLVNDEVIATLVIP